jgi:hypothetical protein
MAVMTNDQPIVGAYGDIYTADSGTPVPTDIDAPGAAWTKLGMISEDGASWTPPEEETAEIKIWQTPYPARTVTTGLSSSLTFALDGWDRVTVPFAMGGGTFTDAAGTTVVYSPPKPGESEQKSLFMKVLDGAVKLGLYFAKGKVTGRDDTVFKPDEAALLNVEFSLQGDANLDPFNLVFDKTTFPGSPITATGATAGSPGAFTPTGATPPADLPALQAGSITASPATAWTTGQHVVLGNNQHAYWNSLAWASGDASMLTARESGESQ